MKRIVAIAAIALLSLGGCQLFKAANVATAPVGSDASIVAQKAALAAKLTFEGTLQAAVFYIELPRCGRPTSPITCSQQSVVDEMRKRLVQGNAAVQAAENAARAATPDTAVLAAALKTVDEAQTALQAIVDANKVK